MKIDKPPHPNQIQFFNCVVIQWQNGRFYGQCGYKVFEPDMERGFKFEVWHCDESASVVGMYGKGITIIVEDKAERVRGF